MIFIPAGTRFYNADKTAFTMSHATTLRATRNGHYFDFKYHGVWYYVHAADVQER